MQQAITKQRKAQQDAKSALSKNQLLIKLYFLSLRFYCITFNCKKLSTGASFLSEAFILYN